MKVRVICYPRKLFGVLAGVTIIFIVIQLSGYGLKDLERSNKYENIALPTTRQITSQNKYGQHDRHYGTLKDDKHGNIAQRDWVEDRDKHNNIAQRDWVENRDKHNNIAQRDWVENRDKHGNIAQRDWVEDRDKHGNVAQRDWVKDHDKHGNIAQRDWVEDRDKHGNVAQRDWVEDHDNFVMQDRSRFTKKSENNRIAGIRYPYNKNIEGLQIQMPEIINENEVAAIDPSNPPSNRYHEVPPSFLEEDTCPACFGTSICDQFYAGHIKLDTETEGLAKIKYVYFGSWERRSIGEDQRPLPVVVKRLVKDNEWSAFEDFLCRRNTSKNGSSGAIGCDVGHKILKTKLASGAALKKEYVRSEFYKVAHQHPTSLGLALCASQRLLDNLTKMFAITDKTMESSANTAMLSTSFVLNPEGLVLKFCHQYIPEVKPYFPTYYGECGRMIVVQPGGKPLDSFLKETWQVRVDVAFQILQMLEDFLTSNPSWMLFFVDIRFDNFCVSDDGRIQLIDLEDVAIIDRQDIRTAYQHPTTSPDSEPCNEECLFTLAKALYENPSHQCSGMHGFAPQVMYMLACQRLISDSDNTKYMRLFDNKAHHDHPGGLLHDIPYELEPKMSELLYECVFESKPGSRLYAVKALKKLLGIVRKSFKK